MEVSFLQSPGISKVLVFGLQSILENRVSGVLPLGKSAHDQGAKNVPSLYASLVSPTPRGVARAPSQRHQAKVSEQA